MSGMGASGSESELELCGTVVDGGGGDVSLITVAAERCIAVAVH